jgi:hypothetical protein
VGQALSPANRFLSQLLKGADAQLLMTFGLGQKGTHFPSIFQAVLQAGLVRSLGLP